jgi:hypothetical protein
MIDSKFSSCCLGHFPEHIFLFLNVSEQLSVSFEANVRPSARDHATTDERILIKSDI